MKKSIPFFLVSSLIASSSAWAVFDSIPREPKAGTMKIFYDCEQSNNSYRYQNCKSAKVATVGKQGKETDESSLAYYLEKLSYGSATDVQKNTNTINHITTRLDQGLSFAGNEGSFSSPLGSQVQVLGIDNIYTSAHEGGILKIGMKNNPSFSGEVTANGGLRVGKSLSLEDNTQVNMGGNRLENVGDAQHETDAVNLRQLNQMKTQWTSLSDKQHHVMKMMKNYRSEAQAGTASAMAMASLPQASSPDQLGLSLGAAVYRGQSAYALGLSKMSSSGKSILKGSVSADMRGGLGMSVGAYFSFD